MKTVNRGWLKRQVEAGKVEAKCVNYLTDDYAFDASNNFGRMSEFKPAVLQNRGDKFLHGVVNLHAEEFNNKGGGAYRSEDGIIHYYVHSNLSYELRIK